MEGQGHPTWMQNVQNMQNIQNMQNVQNVVRSVPVVGSLNGSKKRVYRALSGVSFQGMDAQPPSIQDPSVVSCDAGQAYPVNSYGATFQQPRFEGPCSLENNADPYGTPKSRSKFFSLGRTNGKQVAAGMPDSLENAYTPIYPGMVPQPYTPQQDYYNSYSNPRYAHSQQTYYHPNMPPQAVPVVYPQSQQHWNQQTNFQPIMAAPYTHIPRHQQHLRDSTIPAMYAQSQQNYCHPVQHHVTQTNYGNTYYTPVKSNYEMRQVNPSFEQQHDSVKNERILSADSLEKITGSPSRIVNMSATEPIPRHKLVDRVDSVESNCEKDSLEDVRPRHFSDIKSFFENKSSTSSISQVHRSLSSCGESTESKDISETDIRRRNNSEGFERSDSSKTYFTSRSTISEQESIPLKKNVTPKCSNESILRACITTNTKVDNDSIGKEEIQTKTNKPEKSHIGDVKFLRATKDTPQTIMASARLVRATMKAPMNPKSFYIALESKFPMPEFKARLESENKDGSKSVEDASNVPGENCKTEPKKDASPADYLESQLQLQHYVKDWADTSFSSDSECDEFFLVLDSTDYTQPLISDSTEKIDTSVSELVLHDDESESDKTDECTSSVSTATKSDDDIALLPDEIPKTAENKEDFLEDKPTLKISEHFLELGKGIDTDVPGDFTLVNRKLKFLINKRSNEKYVDQSNRKLIFLKVNVGKPVTGIGESYNSLVFFDLNDSVKQYHCNILPSTSIEYMPITITPMNTCSNYAKLIFAEIIRADIASSHTCLRTIDNTFLDNCGKQSSLPLAKGDLEIVAVMVTKHLKSSFSSNLSSTCDAANNNASITLNSDITKKYFANMDDSEFRYKIANFNKNIYQLRTSLSAKSDGKTEMESKPSDNSVEQCDTDNAQIHFGSVVDERKISESSGVSSLSESEMHGAGLPMENVYASKDNISYDDDWKWIGYAHKRHRESIDAKHFKRQDSSFSNSSYQSSGVSSVGSDFPDGELQLCSSGISLLSNIEEEFKSVNMEDDVDDVGSLTISVNGNNLMLPVPVWPPTDLSKCDTQKNSRHSNIGEIESQKRTTSGNHFINTNSLGNSKNSNNSHRIRRKTIHVFENINYDHFHQLDIFSSSKLDSSSCSSEASSVDDLMSMRGLFDSNESMQSIASEIMPIFIDQEGCSTESIKCDKYTSYASDLFRIATKTTNFKLESQYSPKIMQKLPPADSKSLPNLSDIGEANILDEINSKTSKNSLTLEETESEELSLRKTTPPRNCETQIVTHVFAEETTTDDEYSLSSESEHESDMEDLNFELFEPRAWSTDNKYSSVAHHSRKSRKLAQLRRKFSFNSAERSKELKETFVSSLQRIKMAKHKIDRMVQKTLKSETKANAGVKERQIGTASSQAALGPPPEPLTTEPDRETDYVIESDDDRSLYSWSDAESEFEYTNLRPDNADNSSKVVKIAEPPRHTMEPSFSKELWRKILQKKFHHPFRKGTLTVDCYLVCEYLEEHKPLIGPMQQYVVAF